MFIIVKNYARKQKIPDRMKGAENYIFEWAADRYCWNFPRDLKNEKLNPGKEKQKLN